MNISCRICEGKAHSRPAVTRGGKPVTLWHCFSCDFDFFAHDPTAGLIADRLDQTRLQAAGLDVPAVEQDFANGLRQAMPYMEEYMDASDRNSNILEIGCSRGYFLKLVQDAGAKPYGVELNTVRAGYVNEKLGIPCDGSLDECEKRGIRFKKIFMFYVLEYVPQPLRYLQRLVDLLEDDGKLVLITPSLRDPLKDLWRNTGFMNFFYDEHAVNYLSPLSAKRLVDRMHVRQSVISTRQGYSFVNHVSWFLSGSPRTTGVVGGDNFVNDIVSHLRAAPCTGKGTLATDSSAAAAHLANMIQDFDIAYKQYLESQQRGNQIRIIVCK